MEIIDIEGFITDLNKLCAEIYTKVSQETGTNIEIIHSLERIKKELEKLSAKYSYNKDDEDLMKKLYKELDELNKKLDDTSPQTDISPTKDEFIKKFDDIVFLSNVRSIKLENKLVPIHPKVNEALEKLKTCVFYTDSNKTWYCYHEDFQFAIKPQPMNQNIPTFYVGKIEYPKIFESSKFFSLYKLKWCGSTAIKIGDFTFEILVSYKDKYLRIREIFCHQLNENTYSNAASNYQFKPLKLTQENNNLWSIRENFNPS